MPMTATSEIDLFRIHSKKIAALLKARRWEIDDAVFHARQRGVRLSRQTLVDLLNGKSRGRVDTLGKLKVLFDVPADDLMIDE
jgi:hypothetical protein